MLATNEERGRGGAPSFQQRRRGRRRPPPAWSTCRPARAVNGSASMVARSCGVRLSSNKAAPPAAASEATFAKASAQAARGSSAASSFVEASATFELSATSAPTTSRAAVSIRRAAQHGAASTDDVAAAARARPPGPPHPRYRPCARTFRSAAGRRGPAGPRKQRDASLDPFARASTKARAATAAPGPPIDARRDRASMGDGASASRAGHASSF